MKNLLRALLMLPWLVLAVPAAERISDGGVEVELRDLLASGEATILVFYAPWDTTSSALADEVENWESAHPGFTVYLIDVVDERTQVYRQFELKGLPAILLYDKRGDQIGGELDNVDDMEVALQDEGLL
jgi:thiol-disulfide isomerase/thioredoxin